MPSKHTRNTPGKDWDPEPELAETYGEDPARFVEGGALLTVARVRGIEDVDLLRAYARVEADRYARQSVIAVINQRIAALTSD